MSPESTFASVPSVQSFSIPVFSQSFGSWRLSVDRRPFDEDDLAAQYDRQSTGWHHIIERHGFTSAYHTLFARIFRQPRYQQDTSALRVLEAGVGTGAMSSALRSYVGRRFKLDAIDISSAMLRQAVKRLEPQDIEVCSKRGTLVDLPYEDGTFDVVLAAHVIEHLPEPEIALRELYRVLKPGGILIGSVTRTSFFGTYVQLIWRTHRVSQATAQAWFRQCGLRSVRAVPFERKSRARRFSLGYVGLKPSLS